MRRLNIFTPIMSVLMLLMLGALAFVDFGLDLGEGVPVEMEYPWVYLRDGQALESDERVVEIIAVGDIMLGRGVSGVEGVFSKAAPWLSAADLALGNFEGAIPVEGVWGLENGSSPREANGAGASEDMLDHGSSMSGEIGTSMRGEIGSSTGGKPALGGSRGDTDTGNIDPDYAPYELLIPPESSETLRSAGFDLLSLANNHTLDAGVPGLLETSSRLKASGIEPLGVDPDPTIHKANGLRIAFMALNLVPGGIDSDIGEAEDMMRAARALADVVIVSVHWGLEYHLEPSLAQERMAHQLSQAGADLVLGHHPHVVQPLEIVRQGEADSQRDTLVAYSLGNFVFDQFDERTRQGLALRVFVDQKGLRAVQALPVEAGTRPRLASLQESAGLLARVSPPPRRVGFACEAEGCWSIPAPQEERSGIFWAGQIDLTGDGVPETVRRTEQAVTIYQDGEPVWRSLPEWEVLDLALGDPNDDGRTELLLALDKPGPQGEPTSHPFILGYRGGAYRVLWGGSAVSGPLLEVELGDLDGDGVQELIVLEAPQGGDRQTVAVWRWHGWGFSQLWRGSEGLYRDVILTSEENGAPLISVAVQEPID